MHFVESGEDVAQYLGDCRRREGLTQVGLGCRTGLSQVYISKVENHELEPTVTNLIKMVRGNRHHIVLIPFADDE